MSQKATHRYIHKISLNEQKVAQFLFELLRDNFISPKTPELSPKKTKNMDIYPQLIKVARMAYDFIRTNKTGDVDEKQIEVRLLQCIKRIESRDTEPITFWETTKTLFLIWIDALDVDIIIAALNNENTRTKLISILRWLSKVSFLIPFENFSLEKIAENKFEKLIWELSSEADVYKNANYNISFNLITGFLASVAIIVSIVAYKFQVGGVSDLFKNIINQPFYYWIIIIILYIAAVFLWLLLQNFYERRKREYLINILSSIKDPLVNPELINHDYLLFIRDIMMRIKKLWPDEKKMAEYELAGKQIDTILEIRFGNRWKGWIKMFFEVLKSNWLVAILTVLYFVILGAVQAYFHYS